MSKTARSRHLSLRGKIVLLTSTMVFLTALFTSIFYYQRVTQLAMETALEKLAGETRLTAANVKNAYREIANDLMNAEGLPRVAGIIRIRANGGIDPLDGTNQAYWSTRMGMLFTSLMKANPEYMQIRYIGVADGGRELVRAVRRDNGIAVLPETALERTAGRPFFRDASTFQPGQVKFSDVLLPWENDEGAQIATSAFWATIPIYDNTQYFGMITISVDYHKLIQSICGDLRTRFDTFILNSYGDYIHRDGIGTISNLESALNTPSPSSFFIDSFKKFHGEESQFVDGAQIAYLVRAHVNPSQPNYNVGVVLEAPQSHLFASANLAASQSLFFILPLILVASILAGVLADRLAQPMIQMTQAVVAYGDNEDKAVLDLPVKSQDEVGALARAFQTVTEKLARSHARQAGLSVQLEAIINNAVDGLIIVDERGIIEEINPACVSLFGYQRGELIGQNVARLLPEPEARRHNGYISDYRRSGVRKMIGRIREEQARRKDGSIFHVSLSISEVKLADRRIFTGIIRDISLQKSQEAALRASEAIFRSAMLHSSIGKALVSLDGKFLEVNRALCTLLDYDEETLKRLDFQAIAHPDDLKADPEHLDRVLAGSIDNYEMEKRYITRTGNVVSTLLSVSLARNPDGSPAYFISQIQDITARREMDRMKDEFVSMVSHELRTPLTAIKGSVGLIGRLAGEIPQRAANLLDIANQNCERLTVLINDILDMEKIGAGRMDFEMAEEDFFDVVERAVKANESYARARDVSLVLTGGEHGHFIDVDEARLTQVITNLLSNAAKFSPAGAPVEVRLERIGERARLSVQDHGPGIPEAFRARIFGRFAQSDSSSVRQKGGSGLGLYLSKQIMEHMGGTIGFDSVEGAGTVFWIELPLHEARVPMAIAS